MDLKDMERGKFFPRTDLAVEARELIGKDGEIDGIRINTENAGDISVTTVEILDEKGASQMGKDMGTYISIESAGMGEKDVSEREAVMKKTAEGISKLMKARGISDGDAVLIAGLGNRHITADSLGPKVIDGVLATRHITKTLPNELGRNVRPVCAVAPGVMGITGIETGEIICGITEKVRPKLIITIDSLAARKMSRINSVIQMSDTGISPGSGVGNTRMPLNEKSLGVPVIAIGVPTVVDAATLVNDTMERLISQMIQGSQKGGEFYKMLENLSFEDKYALILEILEPYAGNMFVTPKEVDSVVENLANIISNALNIALQKNITLDDINRFK